MTDKTCQWVSPGSIQWRPVAADLDFDPFGGQVVGMGAVSDVKIPDGTGGMADVTVALALVGSSAEIRVYRSPVASDWNGQPEPWQPILRIRLPADQYGGQLPGNLQRADFDDDGIDEVFGWAGKDTWGGNSQQRCFVLVLGRGES